MKKKIFGGIAVVAIAVAVAFNVNLNMSKTNHVSLLALANVEALADDESINQKGTAAKAEETKTVETYTTSDTGWEWDVSLNVWLFKGSVSHSSPKNYTKTTVTKKLTWDCCLSSGDADCTDIPC